MKTRQAHLVAAGPEDDSAYRALHDVAGILARHPEARVIGGHMVGIITAAFPSPGFIERRTGDADAGITLDLADSGGLHAELTEAGYTAENGNRYVRAGIRSSPTIDLLIPNFIGRFAGEIRGGRRFDSSPGLALALGRPLAVDVHLTLQDGSQFSIRVRVPTVEAAIVLKSYAWHDRGAQTPKDIIDLSNLFHVLDEHGSEALGGWNLDSSTAVGARRDAARYLHELAARLANRRTAPSIVDSQKLAVLIRRHVFRA